MVWKEKLDFVRDWRPLDGIYIRSRSIIDRERSMDDLYADLDESAEGIKLALVPTSSVTVGTEQESRWSWSSGLGFPGPKMYEEACG